jgi:glycosyltransferase involved in cell wall biosynthesis
MAEKDLAMNIHSPLFSIVIPTRNRANLLQYALLSAVRQEFDDYEIIVSDNHSQDGTAEVVRKLADGRVRYIRTNRSLSMPNSWESALSHARGEYITYLCDDDAIRSVLLKRLAETLSREQTDIVSWPGGATYYHDSWTKETDRNTLHLHVSGGTDDQKVKAESIYQELFNCRFTQQLPRLLNSCAHRGLLNEIRHKLGRVFWPTCPDYTAGIAQLAFRKELVYLDELLLVWGVATESIGASQSLRGTAANVFLDELRNDNAPILKYVPAKIHSPMNYALDSLLFMKDKLGALLSGYIFNTEAYYTLMSGERGGSRSNADTELAEFRRALRSEGLDVQLKVLATLTWQNLRGRAARQAHRWGIARSSRRLRCISGQEYKFSNIFECVQHLDKIISAQQYP